MKCAPWMFPCVINVVCRGNRAAMGFHNLPGDGKTQAGMYAEILLGPVGEKALENALNGLARMPGPLSSTVTMILSPVRSNDSMHLAMQWRKGKGIVDQIAEHLA